MPFGSQRYKCIVYANNFILKSIAIDVDYHYVHLSRHRNVIKPSHHCMHTFFCILPTFQQSILPIRLFIIWKKDLKFNHLIINVNNFQQNTNLLALGVHVLINLWYFQLQTYMYICSGNRLYWKFILDQWQYTVPLQYKHVVNFCAFRQSILYIQVTFMKRTLNTFTCFQKGHLNLSEKSNVDISLQLQFEMIFLQITILRCLLINILCIDIKTKMFSTVRSSCPNIRVLQMIDEFGDVFRLKKSRLSICYCVTCVNNALWLH